MHYELLSSARSAIAVGHHLTARTLLVAFVRANPGHAEGWHLLGSVLDDPIQKADCEKRARAGGYTVPPQQNIATTPSSKAATLVAYVRSLADFVLIENVPEPYNHMGATITDAILQAGLNYQSVVRPRVQHIREQYPTANTTSNFLRLLEQEGPTNVIRWTHHEKSGRIFGLARFLQEEELETEQELASWLLDPTHVARLKQLRGIGDKTADYIKILTGLPASAIDRHVLRFLYDAGVAVRTYADAQQVINAAADLLAISYTRFDLSIWTYISNRQRTSPAKPSEPSHVVTQLVRPIQSKADEQHVPGLVRVTKEAGEQLQAQYGTTPIPGSIIQREAARLGEYSEGSIFPSDYCYNLMHRGAYSLRYPMFERVERGKYIYLGLNYNYTGPIFCRFGKGDERRVGEWQAGICVLHDDPRR